MGMEGGGQPAGTPSVPGWAIQAPMAGTTSNVSKRRMRGEIFMDTDRSMDKVRPNVERTVRSWVANLHLPHKYIRRNLRNRRRTAYICRPCKIPRSGQPPRLCGTGNDHGNSTRSQRGHYRGERPADRAPHRLEELVFRGDRAAALRRPLLPLLLQDPRRVRG